VKPISDGLSSSLFALLVNQWFRFFVVYRQVGGIRAVSSMNILLIIVK